MEDELIIQVDKELAILSLGFSIDAGGSILKLVYRSKEDYENGKPKDEKLPYGKLRLRILPSDDVDGLLKILRENCDIMEESRRKSRDSTDEPRLWCQTGCYCQFWKKVLDKDLTTRTLVIGEADLQGKGLRGFYTNSRPSGIYQRLLPLSTQAVDKARKLTVAKKKSMDILKSIGEKSFSKMMNRRAPGGVDLDEYKVKLQTIDATELAAEMSLTEIEYPCILIVIGSVMSLYLLDADESSIALDLMPLSTKMFVNIGMKLTGAKDYHELEAMIERGNPKKINLMAEDTKFQDRTDDDWYNLWDDDILIFAFGKLCNENYRGTYSNDDLAAAWALSFCINTAKILSLHCVAHNVKSVLVSGSFINNPMIRECFEEMFMLNSLSLPFTGAHSIKMTSLPNPGFVGALGTWMYNWESEQEEYRIRNQAEI